MRELPEPHHGYQDGHDQYGVPVRVDYFSRDQVLAIQKQAYEDGLRDAWNKINSSLASDPELRNGMVLATNLIADMLKTLHKQAPESRIDYGVTKPHPFKD